MKTKYKHIEFGKVEANYECYSSDSDYLGYTTYYRSWRQFIFEPAGDYVIFSASCLRDIAHFLDQLNKTKGCYKEKK